MKGKRKKDTRKTYYAVRYGFENGVFTDNKKATSSVTGYKGSLLRKTNNYKLAKNFADPKKSITPFIIKDDYNKLYFKEVDRQVFYSGKDLLIFPSIKEQEQYLLLVDYLIKKKQGRSVHIVLIGGGKKPILTTKLDLILEKLNNPVGLKARAFSDKKSAFEYSKKYEKNTFYLIDWKEGKDHKKYSTTSYSKALNIYYGNLRYSPNIKLTWQEEVAYKDFFHNDEENFFVIVEGSNAGVWSNKKKVLEANTEGKIIHSFKDVEDAKDFFSKYRKFSFIELKLEDYQIVKQLGNVEMKEVSKKRKVYNFKTDKSKIKEGEVQAYVDGSYSAWTLKAGSGILLIDKDKDYFFKACEVGIPHNLGVFFAEYNATLLAIKWAIENKYKTIVINHDFISIDIDQWNKNDRLTINKRYKELIEVYEKDIEIVFNKVYAHVGHLENEIADILATMGREM